MAKAFLLAVMLLVTRLAVGQVLTLQYEGFTIWLDCGRRGAVKFAYLANKDSGQERRQARFFKDPAVPENCQQTSTGSYAGAPEKYDRGHLVPANHLDHSATAIRQTNYMTNILPQAAAMNRGAWLRTEEIVECLRDHELLYVVGGVIWGSNDADDYFLQSHGVRTPDAYWKVIIGFDKAIAWVIPNSQEAVASKLDSYLVSIPKLEELIGEKIPLADAITPLTPSRSWEIPAGCDKS